MNPLSSPTLHTRAVPAIAGLLLLPAMFWLRSINYMLFHGVGEVISIVIAGILFTLAWDSRRFRQNGYLLIVGIGYLGMAILGLTHTMTYRGLGVLEHSDTNAEAQLWAAARYLQAFSLLAAPAFIRRRVHAWAALGACGAVVAMILLSVFYWRTFPAGIDSQQQPTRFTRISEWATVGILFAALLGSCLRRQSFAPEVRSLLLASVLATLASAVGFASTQSAEGVAGVLGHYFKIIAFYLLYRAFVEDGLAGPGRLIQRQKAQLASTVAALETELLAVSEREQRRIGHDLHDTVGQNLTAIAYLAADLSHALAERHLSEAREAQRIESLANSTVELTRSLARSLSPLGDKNGDLVTGLRELTARVSGMFDVSCVAEQGGAVDLGNGPAGIHLYRIAQEAISNAIRHGKADKIVVRLEGDGQNVRLTVRDNGIGLPAETNTHGGMGLRIMKYRADSLGANLTIRRAESGGTLLVCMLPRTSP